MKLLRTLVYGCSFVAAALFCSLAVAATGNAPAQITVGTLYASSGTTSSISVPVHKGLKLWVKQVNADGGVYVKPYDQKIPVKLVSYDDQGSTATAATLYNRLITQDQVDILTSDSGSVLTSVGVPIAREHKMLLFDQTGSGSKFFTPDNHYIVLLDVPVSSRWPRRLPGFLEDVATQHGIHKVAILYATNDFTGTQARTVHHMLTHKDSKHIKVVYYHGVPTNTSSYTVLLHSIKATQPDAVIELGYPANDIAFLRDLQSSGEHFPMVYTIYAGLETGLLKKNDGADALQGIYTYITPLGLNYKPDVGMDVSHFKKAYHKTYGADAVVGFNSIAGYNTGLILQETLAHTQSMQQLDLRKAVASLSGNLLTLDGHFKLDETGAQTGELMPIAQIQSANSGIQLMPVYPAAVARGKPQWQAQQ